MANDNLEVEVKFLVSDLNAVRERLQDAGAILARPRVYEINIRYDNAWQGLLRQGKLLRLRQDTAARVTFKGNPQEEVKSEARVREELETEVGDFDTLSAILERVGFEPQQIYEKYRETFTLGDVEVVLDEMPFGDFIELEGEEQDIRSAAARLDLSWDKRILANYLALMASLKEKHDLAFDDLTFDNFIGLPISAADLFETST